MGKKNKPSDKDNTHGKNSIEAAADKTVGGIKAMKEQAQEYNKSPAKLPEASSVHAPEKEGIADQAKGVAGAAAAALGASIPQANKGETLEVEQSVGGGASAPSADVKQPPLTAAEIVDRANRAMDAGGRAPVKNGSDGDAEAEKALESGKLNVEQEASSVQKKGQRAVEEASSSAEKLGTELKELAGDAKDWVSQKAGEAKEATENLAAVARKEAEHTKQKVSDETHNAKETAKGKFGEAREEARTAAQGVSQQASELKGALKEKASKAREETQSAGRKAADLASDTKEAGRGFPSSSTGTDTDGLDRDSLLRVKQQAQERTGALLSKGLSRPVDNPTPHQLQDTSVGRRVASTADSAKSEANGAAETVKSVYREAKDTVESSYRDAKDTVAAGLHDAEEKARSALEGLRSRLANLDAEMQADNFVDDSLSRGRIPSNTQDVLAAQGRT